MPEIWDAVNRTARNAARSNVLICTTLALNPNKQTVFAACNGGNRVVFRAKALLMLSFYCFLFLERKKKPTKNAGLRPTGLPCVWIRRDCVLIDVGTFEEQVGGWLRSFCVILTKGQKGKQTGWSVSTERSTLSTLGTNRWPQRRESASHMCIYAKNSITTLLSKAICVMSSRWSGHVVTVFNEIISILLVLSGEF